MSSIKDSIKDAMKEAMRAKEKERLSTIRLIQAEFKRVEVDERIELDDDRILTILDKMCKQRRDSIADSGAESMKDMGKVMAILKPKIQGRADVGAVSGIVKNQLN